MRTTECFAILSSIVNVIGTLLRIPYILCGRHIRTHDVITTNAACVLYIRPFIARTNVFSSIEKIKPKYSLIVTAITQNVSSVTFGNSSI